MKSHPDNYVIIINRSQEEINYLVQNTSVKSFVSYFNKVPVVSSFQIDKNFVLIEIPYTYLGEEYGWYRENSYIELYSDKTLLPPGINDLTYYLNHSFTYYNYLVIYPTVQEFYYSFDPNEFEKSKQDFIELDLNKDETTDEGELALYYLTKLVGRLLDYRNNPIETDYLVVYENEAEEAVPGMRAYCEGYSNNSIYKKMSYSYSYFPPSSNIKSIATIEDKCNSTKLLEVYCNDGKLEHMEIVCPLGSCVEGTCVNSPRERYSIFTLIIRFLFGQNNENNLKDITQSVYSWVFNQN